MSGGQEECDAAARRDHEAAAWVVRQARGLNGAEQDEFSQWLAADPRHRACFADQRHHWRLLDELSHWRPEHAQRPNPDLLAPPRAVRRSAAALWWSLAAAVVVLGAVLAWRTSAGGPAVADAVERRVLEDGSTVDLNRGAAIAVEFAPGRRQVTLLRGEAHFSVKKDPARPFVVRAGGVGVEAVGTAFNVHLDPGDVEVLVTEGRVRVTPPQAAAASPAAPTVGAGELARVSRTAGQPVEVEPVSAERQAELLAWQPRRLDFSGAALPEILAEFNRRNRVQIVIVDPELETLRLTVSFRSDNVDGFVRLLEGAFGVRVERREDAIALRRAR